MSALNPRLAARPTFRGFPVPFFALIDKAGVPDFKVVSDVNRMRCAKERLCWMCGEPLSYWIVFVGGPQSAANRAYGDGPGHEECVRDALRICPFLLGRTDYTDIAVSEARHGEKMDAMPGLAAPSADIVLGFTRGFTVLPVNGGWLFRANPLTRTETIPRIHATPESPNAST